MENENKTVSVELSSEQYAFLTDWQKKHQDELGIEVPLGALVRKAVDASMKAAQRPPRAERDGHGPHKEGPRPPRGDKPSGDWGPRKPFGAKSAGRSFGGKSGFGLKSGRPAPRAGIRGPKFDMADSRKKRTKTFD